MKRTALSILVGVAAAIALNASAVVGPGGGSGASLPTQTGNNGKFLSTDGTTAFWQALAGGGDALVANPLSQFAPTTSAQLRTVLSDETGTGLNYFQGGDLGTPSAGVLTNATGLPIGTGVSGLGTGCATFLATPSSANLRGCLTDEVGTGAFYTVGGALGTPASVTLTNATGLPLSTGVSGTLPVANGGTGTTTPGIVAGTNVSVSGTWPNQTVNSTGGAPGGSSGQVQYNNAGAQGGITAMSGDCTWTIPGGVITCTKINGSTVAPFSGSLVNGGALYSDGTNVLAGVALTLNQIMLGGGASGAGPKPLGSLGTTTTVLHGNASGASSFGPVVGADMTANTVTSTQLAVVNTRRVCDIAIGDTSAAAALGNSALGPQKRICYIPSASTVVEVTVAADAGTPNIIVAKNSAGTVSNLVSAALAAAASGGIACSKSSAVTGLDGVTTCSATLQNTSLAAGDYIELVSGTAGGTAKFMSAHIIYTVN